MSGCLTLCDIVENTAAQIHRLYHLGNGDRKHGCNSGTMIKRTKQVARSKSNVSRNN